MKILFVSRIKNGSVNPFIFEQGEALKMHNGHDIRHFLIKKGGIFGYIDSSLKILKLYNKENFDLVHAHNGLSGFSASISKILSFYKMKLIITFHGTDINNEKERKLSYLASKISDFNILVSSFMKMYISKNSEIIPCGIDMEVEIADLNFVRNQLNWPLNEFVILFSSAFDRKIKDPEFAFQVIDRLRNETDIPIRFLELNGLTRDQVNQYMQASNLLLMCSFSEGSPQVIKEAILNRLPVITNDVGEVRSICNNVDSCFIVPKTVEEFLNVIKKLVTNPVRILNNKEVLKFDNKVISSDISKLYEKIKVE